MLKFKFVKYLGTLPKIALKTVDFSNIKSQKILILLIKIHNNNNVLMKKHETKYKYLGEGVVKKKNQ